MGFFITSQLEIFGNGQYITSQANVSCFLGRHCTDPLVQPSHFVLDVPM